MMWLFITVAAGIALAFLGRSLFRRFGSDGVAAIVELRRAGSRFVSRGELVDGESRVPVALSVTRTDFCYENSTMNSSIDLRWIEEVQYDTELASGRVVVASKVLRLRARDRTVEIILPIDVVSRWHLMMPRRIAKPIRHDLDPLVRTA